MEASLITLILVALFLWFCRDLQNLPEGVDIVDIVFREKPHKIYYRVLNEESKFSDDLLSERSVTYVLQDEATLTDFQEDCDNFYICAKLREGKDFSPPLFDATAFNFSKQNNDSILQKIIMKNDNEEIKKIIFDIVRQIEMIRLKSILKEGKK